MSVIEPPTSPYGEPHGSAGYGVPPFTTRPVAPPPPTAGSRSRGNAVPPPGGLARAVPNNSGRAPDSGGWFRSRTGGRLARTVLVGLALALIGTSMAIDPEAMFVIPILFILVVPFEKLFPRHRQRLRRPQLGTDIGYALAGPLLSGVGIAAGVVVAVVSLAWLPGLAVRPLVGMIPGPILPFAGIALFDLAIYWTHRWYHEVPVLWRFHAIHHSPKHMDWISGFRNHPFDGTLIAPAFVFLLAAGFDAEFTGVLAIVQIVLGIFLHANVRWRLRPLHRIVITPEFHHWHHANEPGAINSNYSVFLPAWDLLFGTYFMPKHRRPQVYGVTEHIPEGMVPQLWHPLRGMRNPLWALRHPILATKAILRFVRRLLGDMKRSAKRPRRRSPEDLGPDFPDEAVLLSAAVPASWPPPSPVLSTVPRAILDTLPPPVPQPRPVQPPQPKAPMAFGPKPIAPTEVMVDYALVAPDETVEYPSATSMAQVMGWGPRY